MNAYLTAAQDWLQTLAPRERAMVLVCALVIGLTLLFLGVWEPLARSHAKYQSALAAAEAQAQKLEVLAAAANAARSSGNAAAVGGSLLTVVDQASKSGTLSKPPTRLQPEGDNEVKVWIEGVSFDALIRWAEELSTRYGVAVQSLDVDRDATPGQVNARLSLVRG